MKPSAEVTSKPIHVLVAVHYPDGLTRYEWREVPGTEIAFKGVELKNGETLTIDCSFSGEGDQ